MASSVTKEDVDRWTSEGVATWTSDNGLDATIVGFVREQDIDGDQLLKLTTEHLCLYRMSLGHAGKLMDAINALKRRLGGSRLQTVVYCKGSCYFSRHSHDLLFLSSFGHPVCIGLTRGACRPQLSPVSVALII
jgi:hypothetical protein